MQFLFPCSFSSMQSVGSDRGSVGRTASGTQPNIWVESFRPPLTSSPIVTAAPPSPPPGVWDSLVK